MIIKYTIEMLTDKMVYVKKEQFDDKQEYLINEPHRISYVNSTRGRQEIASELPETYKNAILLIWGDTPTVNEEVAV